MLVEAWLQRAAAARPRHPALLTPQGSLSYAELRTAAQAGAEQLAARGAARGERVAIALPGGAAFAQALHACLLLGAVAVPVDVRLAQTERARLAAGAAVCVEEPLEGASQSLERSSRLPGSGSRPARARAATHDLDAVALVIHTSGTSAAPRAVELTYGNLLWSALGSGVALGVEAEERWLCALPVSHVGGISILLRSAIYATTAVVHERFELDRVLEALREQGVTIVSLVATTLARLLDGGLHAPSALRCALTGGGPIPAELVRRAHAARVPVSLTYGLTEACSQVTTTPLAALERGSRPPGPGPPLFCTRVRIADDGEILVRSPTVATGALATDGWLHTGDLGALDAGGALSVVGRKADTIVSGGENVSPVEVEAVLEAHPGVLEAAVVGLPDEQWGERVAAYVVWRPGAEVDYEGLYEHCRRSLARYKVPKELMSAGEPLPRTASGKLLRRELR